MRRSAILATVAFLALSGCGDSAGNGQSTVTVTGTANVRDAATTNGSRVISQLTPGTEITGRWVQATQGSSDRWFEYATNNGKGYVWEGNISEAAPQTGPATDQVAAEQAAEEVANRSDVVSLVTLKARMRHHLRCLIATQYAPGYIDRLANMPDGSSASTQSMRALSEYHTAEATNVLRLSIGKPYNAELVQYGEEVQDEIKNTVILARTGDDQMLASLQLVNLANSAECKQ